MSLQRWLYAGGCPNWAARLLDRGTAAVSARGVRPEYLVALEVPGRRSGRIVGAPLVVAAVDGERYLVSMLGEEANWVRNVRAAGGEAALRHGPREEAHLEEAVGPDRRAPVLKAYLKRASNASAHVPIDKDAPLAEFQRLAPRFPVFRIVPRNPAWAHRASRSGGSQGLYPGPQAPDFREPLFHVLG
jgi:F420H(2)-dependent quinone reductase